MKQACQGQLLPKITYTVEHASEWASPWGQAASLLQALAEFPRKALADRFFFRDLEAVDDDAVVEAMDLCEDAVRKISNRRDSKQQAKEDLRFLASFCSLAEGSAKAVSATGRRPMWIG